MINPIFIFSGLGAQWAGMGRSLYNNQPVFRQTLERFDTLFEQAGYRSLLDTLLRANADQLQCSATAHRLTFCYQVAFVQLLRAVDITPKAVLGHSSGEVAAAWCAGVLSDGDAITLVEAHCRLIEAVKGKGAMLYAALDQAQAERLLAKSQDLCIAACNSHAAVVISGKAESIDELQAELENRSIFCRRPRTSIGFHSNLLDPHLDNFERELAGLKPKTATCAYYSSLTGNRYQGPWNAFYWRQHIRQPVLFNQAFTQLLTNERPDTILEIAPQPILNFDVRSDLVATGLSGRPPARLLASADREQEEDLHFHRLLETLQTPESTASPAPAVQNSDEVQSVLLATLGELTGNKPTVDENTSWLDLGITSVQILALSTRLSSKLGISIPPDYFFRHPLVVEFAAGLQNQPTQNTKRQTVRDDKEPIAIIGLAFHFPPNLTTQDDLHKFLQQEETAVTEAPSDRPWLQGEKAAFLQRDIWAFDAAAFQISEGEAKELDPQQRLLLEISLATLEDANIPPGSLRGTDVGVYLGISTDDFKEFSYQQPSVSPYTATGNMFNTASGRLSYFHDFHGPSVSIDTACSSSLVAIHQACQALRQGECSLALAGGVNLILSTRLFTSMQAIGALSPTATCNSFSADANGYVRGEGCALLLLKPLSTALADGDRVHAVIRGSAVNQDGRSNGLTAPNGAAQSRLVRLALAQANLEADAISAVETHGTGTPLGDPIEVAALAEAFGDRDKGLPPVVLGALKSHLGHLEACAGVAGLIKMIADMRHGTISGIRGLTRPSEHIQWDSIPLTASNKPTPLPLRSFVAGISSFGYSGTNAHVIIADPETSQTDLRTDELADPDSLLWALSAKSEDALRQLAGRYLSALDRGELLWHLGLSKTQLLGRDLHPFRSAIVTRDATLLRNKLEAVARGLEPIHAIDKHPGRVAMLLPGQGTQYVAMGADLYQLYEAFRLGFDECTALCAQRGYSIHPVVYPPADQNANLPDIDANPYAQLSYLCFAWGAFHLWQQWGIKPDLLIGHSLGEYIAAALAGAMTLEDTVDLIIKRGELTSSLPIQGRMMTVFTDQSTLDGLFEEFPSIDLAVINSPDQLVVAGSDNDLDALAEKLRRSQIEYKPLAIHFASHSRFIEPALEPFYEFCRTLNYQTPQIAVLSNTTGQLFGEDQPFNARYWQEHLRRPVNFSRCLKTAFELEIDTFIEIGPSSVLTSLVRQQTQNSALTLVVTASRTKAGLDVIFEGLKSLFLKGFPVNWSAVFMPFPQPLVDLPITPGSVLHRYFPEGLGTMQHPVQSTTDANTSASGNTSEYIDALLEMVHKITWKQRAEIDPAANLLELGLDSLMLVQLRQQIEKQYQVSISMARLYEELDSLNKIARELEKKVSKPASAATPTPSTTVPTPPMSVSVPGGGNHAGEGIAGLMQQQIDSMRHLFDQQLATLSSLQQDVPKLPVATLPAPPECPLSAGSGFRSMRLQQDSLTNEQKAFITELCRRFNGKTKSSKAEAQKHRTQLADWIKSLGYKQSIKELIYPIIAHHSQGAHFTDIDGNHYLDIAMGYGVGFLGHRHPDVVAAVEEQLKLGFELGPQSLMTGEIAELVCQLTGVERVAFCGSGSEAVMISLRLARAVTGRRKIVIFANSYHGTYDSVLATSVDGTTHPAAAGVPGAMVADILVLNYGDDAALEQIAQVKDQLAAVLVEPVQSRKPDLVPVAFLKHLRELTLKADVPLIFDETITGFRMHPGGAQHLFDIRADMVIYGKAVGGGLPLSMICGDRRYLDAIDGGSWNFGDDSHPSDEVTFFGGTYLKHPLALAATRAGLRFIAEQGPALQERVAALLSHLAQDANAFFAAENVPLKLVYYGSMFRFEGLGRYNLSLNPLEVDLFFYLLMDKGVYTWEKRICFLSVAHTSEDMDRILAAIKSAVAELRAGGFDFALKQDSPSSRPGNVPFYPLSSAQLRLYVFDQLADCKTLYNLPLVFLLHERLDPRQLEDNINLLLKRHQVLTTSFSLDRNQPVQQLVAERTLTLERDSRGDDTIDAVVDRFIRPFNLEQDLLVRTGLFPVANNQTVLIFDFHHIIADGLALNTFLQEISLLLAGNQLPARTARTYNDFVAAEYTYRTSSKYLKDQQFWLQQFEQPVSPLTLQGTQPRPEVQDYLGNNLLFDIPEEMTASLKQTARSCRISLFTLLVSAFALLLQRSSGESRLCIGVPVDTRTSDDAAAMGMFANTLPLVIDLDPDATFAGLTRQVQKNFLEAFEHDRYPLEDLIRQLQLPRDLQRNPLFDVMFIYENGSDRGIRLGDTCAAPYRYNKQTSMFDLTFEVIDLGDQLQCRFEYATALFKQPVVKHLSARLLQLLQIIVNEPEKILRQFDLLTPAEHARLQQFNATAAAYPASATIPDLWQQQVAKDGDATALVYRDQLYTRGWLDQTSSSLAAALIEQLQPTADDRIAIFMERSPHAIAGLLAILKAGAAYVPISMEFPPERRDDILQDSDAKGLLVSCAYATDPWVAGCTMPVIVAEEAESREQPPLDPPSGLTPQHLAYIMFTSGSTGKPKGVMISHGNVISLTENLPRIYNISDQDTLLAVTTFTFDISVLEIISCLLTGTRIVLATEDDNLDIAPLAELMQEHQVTAFQTTPSRLKLLLQLCGASTFPQSLRTLLIGGEAFPSDLFERLKDCPFNVFNVYGPTETTIWSSSELVNGKTRPLIGTPLLNEQLYLLDKQHQPVPPGMVGELYIGGAGVGRGYVNRPELTAEKFVTPPWDSSQTIYATGDLARLSDSGSLEFLGRADDQIKMHGYRIELQEIENCLATHPAIALAAVKTICADSTDEVTDLASYYTLQPQATPPTVEGIREHLGTRLPPYMIPGYYSCLEQMPLNTSGKIDRKALPTPQTGELREAQPERGELSSLESSLLEIIGEILIYPQLAAQDNFFACGGDSVRAVLVVARGREEGLNFTVRDIFTHPTVSALARLLEERQSTKSSEQPPLTALPSTVDSELPLTTTQQGMLFHSLLDPHADAYINQARCTLYGDIRTDLLDGMVKKLSQRHSMLRASMQIDSETPQQRINANGHPYFDTQSLTVTDQEEIATELDKLAVSEREKVQIGGESPLMRLLLVECGKNQWELIWTFHHILLDGWSIAILLKEAAALYRGNELPAKQTDFPDFLAWLNQQDPEATERYWQKTLHHAPPPILFATEPRKTDAYKPGSHRTQTSATVAENLASCHRRYEVTLNSLFLCAWALTLADYAQQQEVLMGATFSGRPEEMPGIDQVVGLFITSLPLRFNIQPQQKLQDMALAMQNCILDAASHQQVNLAELRKTSGNELFEHLIIFENYPIDQEIETLFSNQDTSNRVGSNVRFFEHTHYPLEIMVFPHAGELATTFAYNANQINSDIVEDLATRLTTYLERLATASEQTRVVDIRKDLSQPDTADQAQKAHQHTRRKSMGVAPSEAVSVADAPTMKLAMLFARALDLPEMDVDDNFFSCGGHSLKVVRLAGLIQQQLNCRVALKSIYEHPTPRRLAAHLDVAARSSSIEVTPYPQADSYPLSEGQKGLWLHQQMTKDSVAYNTVGAFVLEGSLDKDCLEQALRNTIKRHESLRTRFIMMQGEPRQVISDNVFPVLDIRHLEIPEDQNTEETIRRDILETLKHPFDLETLPLYHITLYVLNPERSILSLVFHHIVSDGWSDAILARDISHYYHQSVVGTDQPLPPLPVQYRDYAQAQQAYLQTDLCAADRNYWHERLSDLTTMPPILHDYQRPQQRAGQGARLPLTLTDQALEIRRLAQSTQATPFALLHAVVKVLIYTVTQSRDIVIGVPSAQRPTATTQELVGYFLNLLPLRSHIEPEQTFFELVKQLHDQTASDFHHQNYPFGCMVDDLKVEKSFNRHPLFDVMMLFHNNDSHLLQLDDVRCAPFYEESTTSRFDLDFEFFDGRDFDGFIEYDTELYRPQTIEKMALALNRLTQACCETPTATVADLSHACRYHLGLDDSDLISQINDLKDDF